MTGGRTAQSAPHVFWSKVKAPAPLLICCAMVRGPQPSYNIGHDQGHSVTLAWHQRATQRALSVSVEAPRIFSPLRPLFFRIAEQKVGGGRRASFPSSAQEQLVASSRSPLPVVCVPP
ncbi:Piso0_000691 [Millerozyma farinosa CBS 7064]|uniref:Piso0_000691 protein n=1 Tax=Pichia sorbitophila (strain ATCC MYA-4447 / BCRC 22081 / CBS 7064 / NBRC 10061 / NRRL Y-12695) TaxID=559304 RepID=G8YR91_PICSO|nr:Piso0_000691 [Millerozyma farinosa CBS 7064]